MTDAPKRIWANTCVWGDGEPLAGEWNHKDVDSSLDTKYVRADIVDEMLKALRYLYTNADLTHGDRIVAREAIVKAEDGDT